MRYPAGPPLEGGEVVIDADVGVALQASDGEYFVAETDHHFQLERHIPLGDSGVFVRFAKEPRFPYDGRLALDGLGEPRPPRYQAVEALSLIDSRRES